MNPQWFKLKTAGLPRWAWIMLLSGAVLGGLYLRSRSPDTSEQLEESEEIPEGALGFYDGTESAGGLAAAGLVGPAAGSITPVESPYIPEGLVDIFGQLAELVREQGAYIVEERNNKRENEPAPVTGGGAPEAGGSHETPPAPAPAANCTQAERNEIQRLTGEIQDLNGQLDRVNAELSRLNRALGDAKSNSQKDGIRAKINGEQGKRNQLQGSRDSKVDKRNKLQAKCK